MTSSEIAAIAGRQLSDYDARRPGCVFEDSSFRLTLEEAYAVQRQVAKLRAARGEGIAGYKIGCVSNAVQRQLELDRPVFGHVFSTELHRCGSVLKAGAVEQLAIEGEFGIRIAEEIPNTAWLLENPERSIASVFVVIELHNNVFRRAKHTPEELIANNALHVGVVLPSDEGSLRGAAQLLDEQISVFRNGELIGEAAGRDIPGGPFTSIIAIAEQLASAGETLKRGHVLLTGSPLPLYPAERGDRFTVRSLRAGEAHVAVSS